VGIYDDLLRSIIEKIKKNEIHEVAKGAHGTVYKYEDGKNMYIVKRMNLLNKQEMNDTQKEIDIYKKFNMILTKCKLIVLKSVSHDDTHTYLLFDYGGISLYDFIQLHKYKINMIPILIQIIQQLKCLSDNNTNVYTDLKLDNVVVKSLPPCIHCDQCNILKISDKDIILIKIIDMGALYKSTDQRIIMNTGFDGTIDVNDPIEFLLQQFIDIYTKQQNHISMLLPNLTGFAYILFQLILYNVSIKFEIFMMNILKIPNKIFENIKKSNDILNYFKFRKNNLLMIFMFILPGNLSLISLRRKILKQIYGSFDILLKKINELKIIIRQHLFTFLLTNYVNVFNSNHDYINYFIHILGRCCHMDPSERYTFDELIEELHRYNQLYGNKSSSCIPGINIRHQILFNKDRDKYNLHIELHHNPSEIKL